MQIYQIIISGGSLLPGHTVAIKTMICRETSGAPRPAAGAAAINSADSRTKRRPPKNTVPSLTLNLNQVGLKIYSEIFFYS